MSDTTRYSICLFAPVTRYEVDCQDRYDVHLPSPDGRQHPTFPATVRLKISAGGKPRKPHAETGQCLGQNTEYAPTSLES